jgi:hypothetical protein
LKRTPCCYARQDKIWVHDPDGHPWEVYVLLHDAEADDRDDHAEGEEACGVTTMPMSVPIAFGTREKR